LHRPYRLTPIEETLRALDDLVRQGKVRHVGCSNLGAAQVEAAQAAAARDGLAAFVTCQDEYSLLARGIERELIPTIQVHGLGLLPYFPLAGGLLTGKYKEGEPAPKGARLAYSKDHASQFINERNWRIVENFRDFCTRHGRTMVELAFGWLTAKPVVVSVIAGASTPAQVEENVRAGSWALSMEDLSEIDRIARA
jgi:aryl-alcohol dehydrogenase-like predicted oxidoreductase